MKTLNDIFIISTFYKSCTKVTSAFFFQVIVVFKNIHQHFVISGVYYFVSFKYFNNVTEAALGSSINVLFSAQIHCGK